MRYHFASSAVDNQLWEKIAALEGHSFKTARGLDFSYRIKRNKQGEITGELAFDRKEKTITRATIWLAYQNAVAVQKSEGCVSGPKKLGVFGASYLYPVFLYIGVCTKAPMNPDLPQNHLDRKLKT